MDNLALSVTKSITDFLENNEKRFANQNSELERQNKLLADLQAKYEKLEKKFGELENENTNLKSEIQSLKQADDAASNDMMTFKSDLHKMQDQAKKYGDWVNVMGVLTQQVHDLNLIRDDTKRRMDEFFSKQSKLEKIIVKQQREINSVSATARAASASAAAAAAALHPSQMHPTIVSSIEPRSDHPPRPLSSMAITIAITKCIDSSHKCLIATIIISVITPTMITWARQTLLMKLASLAKMLKNC